MDDIQGIPIKDIEHADFTNRSKIYVVKSDGTYEIVPLSEITEFLIDNSQLSSINQKFNELKTTVQAFMDKMLETYVQRDYAERDFDKDQALEKALESTIMSIAKLHEKAENLAKQTLIAKLQEEAIQALYEKKMEMSDAANEETMKYMLLTKAKQAAGGGEE